MKEEFEEKLEEFKGNIKESVNDRISNPFFLVFISVLLIYNWDILLNVFLHEGNTQQKIDDITKQINSSVKLNFFNLRIIYPLIFGLSSYLLFKGLYFLYGKYFGILEIGIINSHYQKIDSKVQGERTVFESKLGIKEIEELNDRIEMFEIDIEILQTSLDKERENSSKLNEQITNLNGLNTSLQKEKLESNKFITQLQIELNNKDGKIIEIQNELKNVKRKYDLSSNQKSNLESLNTTEKSIINILYKNLNAEIINNNGSFDFVKYFMSKLREIGHFSEDNLLDIVLYGFKNLYIESKNRDKQILFYEDFTIVHDVHNNLVKNTKFLINYLFNIKLISLNEDLTVLEKTKIYQLT